MNIDKIKEDFPIFAKHEDLVYLDNAATTQKPRQVTERIQKFYREENSNIGRGVYDLANTATIAYEDSRKTVADFINANKNEIIFVRNTTEAANLVAHSLSIEGEIVLPEMEHHSNQLPWRQKGNKIKYIPTTENHELDLEAAKDLITEDTGLVAVSHSSNVFGAENPVKELTELAHENNSKILVDAAQTAPRKEIDVKELDIDFLTFSGHKMLGPTGIGVLYGKKGILEEMQPYQVGGGMINKVSKDEVDWAEAPEKFEAGTPNIAGAIGFAAAIKYLDEIGMDSIERHEYRLTEKIREELGSLDGVSLLCPEDRDVSIVSFVCDFAHPHDVAEILNQEGVAVRAGHHCAQPQMEQIDANGAVRASPYIYNTVEDIQKLVDGVKKAKKIFN